MILEVPFQAPSPVRNTYRLLSNLKCFLIKFTLIRKWEVIYCRTCEGYVFILIMSCIIFHTFNVFILPFAFWVFVCWRNYPHFIVLYLSVSFQFWRLSSLYELSSNESKRLTPVRNYVWLTQPHTANEVKSILNFTFIYMFNLSSSRHMLVVIRLIYHRTARSDFSFEHPQ